jgi:hypothetical protein
MNSRKDNRKLVHRIQDEISQRAGRKENKLELNKEL